MGLLGPSWFAGDEDAPPGSLYHYTNVRGLRQIPVGGTGQPSQCRVTIGWQSRCGVRLGGERWRIPGHPKEGRRNKLAHCASLSQRGRALSGEAAAFTVWFSRTVL